MKSRGFDGFRDNLKRLRDTDWVKEVVRTNGSEMQMRSQRLSPVDTGSLKRNIYLYIEDGGMSARVASEAEYAVYQELGTRFQSGTPHIKPSYDIQSKIFIEDIEKGMKR